MSTFDVPIDRREVESVKWYTEYRTASNPQWYQWDDPVEDRAAAVKRLRLDRKTYASPFNKRELRLVRVTRYKRAPKEEGANLVDLLKEGGE